MKTWTPEERAFILYFRDEYVDDEGYQLSFPFINDLLARELGIYASRNAVIGVYNRSKKNAKLYGKELIKDYLAGMDICYPSL